MLHFFDSILQRKEGFFPYVFEDLAIEILDSNENLKIAFKKKRKENQEFSENSYEQLYYIYSRSKYAEKEYLRYPIHRVLRN